jgi:hypothetical protein
VSSKKPTHCFDLDINAGCITKSAPTCSDGASPGVYDLLDKGAESTTVEI